MASSNSISFILSQKGKSLLVMENFVFKLNKTTSKTKYYRFEESKCSMTLRTDLSDIIVATNGDHSHPPEPENVELRKVKQVIKKRAIKEATPIPKIYDEETTRFCLTSLAVAILSSKREISSLLNEARRLQMPAIPDSQIFDNPDNYTKTLKGEPFLCIDKLIKAKKSYITICTTLSARIVI